MMLSEGNERQVGAFRIALGIAQVMGATMTLIFLLETGTSLFTYVAGGATLGLVIASRLIFRN